MLSMYAIMPWFRASLVQHGLVQAAASACAREWQYNTISELFVWKVCLWLSND